MDNSCPEENQQNVNKNECKMFNEIASSNHHMNNSERCHDYNEYDDIERARLMANMMETNGGLAKVAEALASRARLVNSVSWLSQQVPQCILHRLEQETLSKANSTSTTEESSSASVSAEGTSQSSSTVIEVNSKHSILDEDHFSDLSDDDLEEDDHSNGEESHEHNSHHNFGILSALHEVDEESDDDEGVRPKNAAASSFEENSSIDNNEIYGRRSSLAETIKHNNQSEKYCHTAEAENKDILTSSIIEPEQADLTNKHEEEDRAVLSTKLPFASRYRGAVLFIDIAGFTKLSSRLNPERFSESINAYFQLIVQEIRSHNGDVLKFAGDALFAGWQVNESDCDLEKDNSISVEGCVAAAISCGAAIVSKCSDYAILSSGVECGGVQTGKQIATMNIRCGLGVGDVAVLHVGDYQLRREFLILGDTIRQSTEACNAASLGEFLVSPEAFEIITKICKIATKKETSRRKGPLSIANKSKQLFQVTGPWQPKKFQEQASMHFKFDVWDENALNLYQKLISLYVHPVVVANERTAANQPRRKSSSHQRHVEEAELRTVYTMFVGMPHVHASISGNKSSSLKNDWHMFKLLNNIMNVTSRELLHFGGHLRQFIVDDKGLVLIVTFGLRGSTFPNMVTEHALPATMSIHNALQSELGVYNKIGATLGNAYCGVVGGMTRNEYAVLGPSVNLAARLMCSKDNPGILVDNNIRMKAGKSYGFTCLDSVKAKGFDERVPIFEPLSFLERKWGRLKGSLVGRKAEVRRLLNMARNMLTSLESPARMAFVSAESGMGKTTTVIHTLEVIRKAMSRRRKRVLFAKHVCKESDRLVPFSMLCSILPDVLGEVQRWENDSGTSTSDRPFPSGLDVETEWDSLSERSGSLISTANSDASGMSGWSASPDRLLHLCRELDAGPEFIELIGHHVLGMDKELLEAPKILKGKPPSLHSTINFMTQAFQACTKRAKLVIIAIDDIHHMDEMSWKVLYKLFITSRNLLIVCTSRPLEKYNLAVDEGFWNDLNKKYKVQQRFIHLDLQPLSKSDVLVLLAKELLVNEEEISQNLCNDVLKRSGGMPHFINEIVEDIKNRNAIVRRDDELYDWKETCNKTKELEFGSISELIIYRIDSLPADTRIILNLAAVLGFSFDLFSITSVAHQLLKTTFAQRELQSEQIPRALEFLVQEKILIQVFEGCEAEDEADEDDQSKSSNLREDRISVDSVSYSFCHDIWRSSVLKLLLDSRKRELHRIIAFALEEKYEGQNKNYGSRVDLFSHWKESGDFSKAATMSLSIAKSFEESGLHEQGIALYKDTVDMLNPSGQSGETIGGLPSQVVKSVSESDLDYIIKVYTGLAKLFANLNRGADSASTYQSALEIFENAPASQHCEDRSIVFPIFSGLFINIKFGIIEQDENCTYEQTLVKQFVNETRLNGDPVHHARALAMLGELNVRLGNLDKAFEALQDLDSVYNADDHSAGICKAYGSDRAAQLFGASALWYVGKNDVNQSLRSCRYVIDELMPKMELRNVHNSAMTLYPVIFAMKENGLALEAREIFVKFVVERFKEYYGDGASTPLLSLYEPILMFLDLAGKESTEINRHEEYLKVALSKANLSSGKMLNNAMGNLGRIPLAMSAEICVFLARKIGSEDSNRTKLIENGLDFAREAVNMSSKSMPPIAHQHAKSVLKELDFLADEIGTS